MELLVTDSFDALGPGKVMTDAYHAMPTLPASGVGYKRTYKLLHQTN